MKRRLVIAGLRNFDSQYSGTRHNVGAMLLTEFARRLKIGWTSNGDVDQATVESDVIMLLPKTYMNLSGRPLKRFLPSKEHAETDLLVVHDELELKLGQAKIKRGGSARGHNGVKSLVDAFGGQSNFPRLLVGIDRPASRSPEAVSLHVLSKFSKSEAALLDLGYDAGIELLEDFILNGKKRIVAAASAVGQSHTHSDK